MWNNISNIKFELISPERLKETCQKDWRLCFICQTEKKEILQNPFSKKDNFIYCILLQYFRTLNTEACWGWQYRKSYDIIVFGTPASLEILSWNFHPVKKIPLGTFLCQKCTHF